MFYNCSNLTTLNLGEKFDTSNVTNMNRMFESCSNLTTIQTSQSIADTLKTKLSSYLSNVTFDTSKYPTA